MTLPAQGEVWWCEPPDIGRRPAIVLSRDLAIAARRIVLVAPCSTNIRGLATEVVLDPRTDPVARMCAANLDALESVGAGVFMERIGRLSPPRMREVCSALAIAVDG